MTDPEYNKLKHKINDIAQHWISNAGFSWWKVDLIWDRNYDEDDRETAAVADAKWIYRIASITFYMPVMQHLSDEEMERVIVHELAHLLVDPITPHDGDENVAKFVEVATENVARALLFTAIYVKDLRVHQLSKIKAEKEKAKSKEDQKNAKV